MTQSFINALAEGLIVQNLMGEVLFANKVAESITGLTVRQMTDKHYPGNRMEKPYRKRETIYLGNVSCHRSATNRQTAKKCCTRRRKRGRHRLDKYQFDTCIP